MRVFTQIVFFVDFFPDESTNCLLNQAREIMKGKKNEVLKRGQITKEDKNKKGTTIKIMVKINKRAAVNYDKLTSLRRILERSHGFLLIFFV